MFFCGYAKKGTFPVDGAVYRKYVPYCKKCNKKDSRTVIQNDKLEILVSFENLVNVFNEWILYSLAEFG